MPPDGEKHALDHGRTRAVLTTGVALLAISATVLLPSCSSSSSSSSSGALRLVDTPYPNGDLSNTRHARGPIRASKLSDLELAWTLPIPGSRSHTASPVVADGLVYSQDGSSSVRAIDLESGDVLWERPYESQLIEASGLVVAGELVYGTTATNAFALDSKTGEEVWSVPLVQSGSERIGMAPGYWNGLVYVSTLPAAQEGGEVGTLWALNGRTGERVWSFETVPRSLWGKPSINFGGGLSYTPAFDDRGFMYFGVGIAGPLPGTKRYPWGSSRPGPNLYTQSVVKLDAETGKLQWYHQVTPHGLCKWDVGAPVLVEAGGRELVIAAGRGGIVVALDRKTGRPVWERKVGRHNGHDDDGLYAMRGEFARLELPMTVYPGIYGGVLAPLSVAGSTAYVPVVNYASRLLSQTEAVSVGSATGELVALDVATGAVEWKHRFSTSPIGPPTAINDLVLATTAGGTIHAFDAASGKERWKVSLPAGVDGGVTISGNTVLVPAGLVQEEGQRPSILAYRLPS